MSRSTQLDHAPHPRFFRDDSQQRRLSALRHKRFSEGRSLATVQSPLGRAREPRDSAFRARRPHDTLVLSPYRTLENSERRLLRARLPSEDRQPSPQSSLRKIRAKSLESKMSFRMRVYTHSNIRKPKDEPRPQGADASAIYEKLFRRRKYGIGRVDPKDAQQPAQQPAHPAGQSSHAPPSRPRPLDSEEDEISRNYIQNEIFMFQNEELEFGYDDPPPPAQEVPPPEEPAALKETRSAERKKGFRKNKYEQANLETIEYEVSGRGTKPPTPRGDPIVIREAVLIQPPDKQTIQSQQ